MLLDGIANIVRPRAAGLLLGAKKHSPELYLISGIAAGVASVVVTARAHKKSDDVFSDLAEEITAVREYPSTEEDDNGLTTKERSRLLIPLYLETGRRAAILYGPGLVLGVGSVALILASHNALQKRNRALLGVVAILQQSFSEYRKRVVAELGEDADERFYYGMETRTVTTVEVDENGKKTKRKETKNAFGETPDPLLLYGRIFEEGNPHWTPDPDHNQFFLGMVQNQMNDRLKLYGYVMLNTVYKALGFKESPEGQLVGWALGSGGDEVVLFGLEKAFNQNTPDEAYRLDFNVNGVVWEYIGNTGRH